MGGREGEGREGGGGEGREGEVPVRELEGQMRGGVAGHDDSRAPVTFRLGGVDPIDDHLLT